MSIDKSLKLGSRLSRPRSVLSRTERIAELKESGVWNEEKSIYGLPKVRVRRAKRKVKVAKVEGAAEAAAVPGSGTAGAAAPSAETKPSKK